MRKHQDKEWTRQYLADIMVPDIDVNNDLGHFSPLNTLANGPALCDP